MEKRLSKYQSKENKKKSLFYNSNEITAFAKKFDDLIANNKLNEAEEYIKLKLKENKSLDILYYLLGDVFLKKQDYKLSRKYFSKSLNVNNKYYPNILGIALSYFNNDNYEDAIKYFQKFIKFDPRNIQSINLLGNSYYIKKDFNEAINNYKKSLNINNNQPFINFSLASIYTFIHEYNKSVTIYKEIYETKSFMDFDKNNIIKFYIDYGKTLEKLDNIKLAKKIYREAINKYEKNTELYNSYIALLLNIEDFNLALNLLEKCIRINPENYQTLSNFGIFYFKTQNYKKAQEYILRAIEKNPENFLLLSNLSSCQIELGLLDQAYENAEKSIQYNNSYPMAYNNMSRILYEKDKIKESLKYAKKAYEINPLDGMYCYNIANCELSLGNKKESRKYYKKALELNPKFGDAFLMLAYGGKVDSETVDKTINLIKKEKLPDKVIGSFCFGLYKAKENAKEFKEAFNFLIKANEFYFRTTSLASLNEEKYFHDYRKLIEIKKNLYSKKNLSLLKGTNQTNNQSIFITGLPRSGTTLIEQMISNHPKVFGAGELKFIAKIKNKFGLVEEDYIKKDNLNSSKELLKILNKKNIELMGREYIKKINHHISETNLFITDKMPSNYMNLGLINLILPSSKIIHIKKDMMDICFSLFSVKFQKGHEFTYNLKYIIEMYKNYENIMNHWKKVLPNKIYIIEYKNLIENTEKEIRKILDFCELEFNENCLNYESNERIVLTASSSQVREKINKNSIGRWKNYEKDLNSFLIENNVIL